MYAPAAASARAPQPAITPVNSALAIAQDHLSTHQLRTAADSYLFKFRNTWDAWDSSFTTVKGPCSYTAQVFAAQTLRHKCKHQTASIPSEHRQQLFSSIL